MWWQQEAQAHAGQPSNPELNMLRLLCRLWFQIQPGISLNPGRKIIFKGPIYFLQKVTTCKKKKKVYTGVPCTTLKLPRNVPGPVLLLPRPYFTKLQVVPLISKYIEKFLDIILKTYPFIFESVLYHIREKIESKLCCN